MCKCRIRTDRESKVLLTGTNEHNHDIDERKLERQQIRIKIKKNASDISTRPSKIIRQELLTNGESHLLPQDLKSLSQSLNRERRRNYPSLPKHREDVHACMQYLTIKTNKVLTMTNLLTALYILIIDNQPLQLNCSSDVVPRGQAASFLINGQDRISVRYEPTLSQCLGTPTSGQSAPFVCANTCSCSSDAKSYTWTYVGIMDTVNGTFTCEMLFGEANIETDTILVAKADHPVLVQTIKQVPEGPVNVNTSITLICSVSGGIPLPTLFWNCGGLVNNTLTNNSTISQISIITSKYHNQEVCTCSAFHPIEYYRTDVHHTLSVLYPPDMEPVIQVLSDLKPLVAGDNIHISCSIIGGNPIANLSWDCPGNVSTQTDNNKAISYLAFEMRAEDDRKTCSCIAAHTVNHFRKSVHYILEVLYFPNITKCAATPNDGRIDEFQTVKLRCEVRGNPLPNISWISSEETILRKDDNISESSLTINKASCIQSGKYRFFAENAICERTHTDSRYIEVNVNCK
ncbi:unnamed protein product [Mytilus coruscus]|uniref:Ig-like domain-containing protein n=1 Tax=Mytilus coruscus TaxID=42192 RepID=A0A6J8CSZ2_MYTCO|nr:unnamed protein product [Mytilus coruscus]